MPRGYDYNINKKVKVLRKRKGYTQESLAKLLDMKTSTYSQMERMGRIPTQTVLKLADIFEVDAMEILNPENEVLFIKPKTSGYIKMEQQPIDTEKFFPEKIALTNREENAIIMLRNLTAEDRENVYNSIKVFHDKKFKK